MIPSKREVLWGLRALGFWEFANIIETLRNMTAIAAHTHPDNHSMSAQFMKTFPNNRT